LIESFTSISMHLSMSFSFIDITHRRRIKHPLLPPLQQPQVSQPQVGRRPNENATGYSAGPTGGYGNSANPMVHQMMQMGMGMGSKPFGGPSTGASGYGSYPMGGQVRTFLITWSMFSLYGGLHESIICLNNVQGMADSLGASSQQGLGLGLGGYGGEPGYGMGMGYGGQGMHQAGGYPQHQNYSQVQGFMHGGYSGYGQKAPQSGQAQQQPQGGASHQWGK
jgi:hypothetical protein